MAYVTREYAEISRRWSLLRYLKEKLFGSWTLSHTAIVSSQFRVYWPMGEFSRPCLVLRRGPANRVGAVGALQRKIGWQLTIITPTAASGEIAGKEQLEVMMERIIGEVHNQKIPFWDYSVAVPTRVADFDFTCVYESDNREAGDKDNLKDRTLGEIRFSVTV